MGYALGNVELVAPLLANTSIRRALMVGWGWRLKRRKGGGKVGTGEVAMAGGRSSVLHSDQNGRDYDGVAICSRGWDVFVCCIIYLNAHCSYAVPMLICYW